MEWETSIWPGIPDSARGVTIKILPLGMLADEVTHAWEEFSPQRQNFLLW